jgi:hypothetical protein
MSQCENRQQSEVETNRDYILEMGVCRWTSAILQS